MMKRKYIMFILLLLMIVLSSCGKRTTKDSGTDCTTITTVTTEVTQDSTSTTTKIETTTGKTTTKTETTSTVTETIVTTTGEITTITTTTTVEGKLQDTGSIYISDYYKDFDYSILEDTNKTNIIYGLKNFMQEKATFSGFGYQWLRTRFIYLDAVSLDKIGDIVAFYSRKHISGTWDQGETWNREHVFARSLGGFDKDDHAGFDMYNIRPTITAINTARGNKVFGTVSHTSSNQVKYQGEVVAWTNGNVFEPCDDVKGDVARICFYVSVMYYMDYSKKVELKLVVEDKTFQTLLEWNEMDPVSEEEIRRCDLISNYLNVGVTFQGNRNIFVDYPEIANIIWG